MNNIMKVGLVGGGAYLLYKVYESYMEGTSSTTTEIPGVTSGAIENTIGISSATPATQTIQGWPKVEETVLQQLAGTTTLQPDQWSWYYSQKTGIAIPGDVFDLAFGPVGSATRGMLYTVDDFYSRLRTAGLGMSGLGKWGRGMWGMGVVAGEFPSGWERANKIFR